MCDPSQSLARQLLPNAMGASHASLLPPCCMQAALHARLDSAEHPAGGMSSDACMQRHAAVACCSGSDILGSTLTHLALHAQSCCLVLFGLLGNAVEWSDVGIVQSEMKQSCNWAAITCIVGVKRTAAAQSLAFAAISVNMDAQALQQFVPCVVAYDGSNIMPSHPSVDLGF